MKTAMQELIDLIELNDKNEPMPFLIDVIKEVYMSKEKDQIFKAHLNGQSEFDVLNYREYNNELAKKYYNETYNHNK